jgi:hypothetical protein
MNIWILLTLICVAIHSSIDILGIIAGITFCYLFLDNKEDSTIIWHFTHWSWFDWRV